MTKHYIIIALKKKGSYGVRISEPNSFPDTVSGFATKADAEAWIARQRKSDADAAARSDSKDKPSN